MEYKGHDPNNKVMAIRIYFHRKFRKRKDDELYYKIAKEYELGKGHLSLEEQKNLREWIYNGINQITDIVEAIGKIKNGAEILKMMAKKYE